MDIVEVFVKNQPAPKGEGKSVTDQLLRLFGERYGEMQADEILDSIPRIARERREIGRLKYGEELTTLNGRWSPADVAQEQYDKTIYMIQAWMEGYATKDQAVRELDELCSVTTWVRSMLMQTKPKQD